jgi:hypothetical protein
MSSLADMRTKAKEAGLMKLDRLIEKRQRISKIIDKGGCF